MKNNIQRGFTLVELMIAIVLGLIVTAAAVQLFITAQRGLVIQQGSSNLQNSASFGLEYMLRDVRLANLNASQPYLDSTTAQGGIVLSAQNLSTKKKSDGTPDFTIVANLLSDSDLGDSNLAGQKSDQLVIQYKNTVGNQYDCEGNTITPANAYVVQRYFLREDSNTNNDPNQPLALACKATTYINTEQAILSGLEGDGQIIIPRVDQFKVILGVARDGANSTCDADVTPDGKLDCFGYITLKNYKLLTKKPQIVSVKIGLLIRSPDSIGQNEFFDAEKLYTILGSTAKLEAHDKNKLYLRDVVTQTVAIRNGFGIEN